MALASPSSAATTIGQLDPAAAPSSSCFGNWLLTQDATSPANAYAVPAAGVITSWSHKAKSTSGRELGLVVFRRTAAAGDFIVVGGSGLKVLSGGTTNTFAVRIAVQAGDLLGLRVGNPPSGLPFDFGGGASCAFTTSLGDSLRQGTASSEPAAGSTVTLASAFNLYRLNVTAKVEADADGDGFGDETQDPCPGSAGSGAACPAGSAPGAGTPARDTRRPFVKASARRSDSIADGYVSVRVVSDEAVGVTARGSVRLVRHARASRLVRLRTVKRSLRANKSRTLNLRIGGRSLGFLRSALRRGHRLRVRIAVSARDAAGNQTAARRAVKLRP